MRGREKAMKYMVVKGVWREVMSASAVQHGMCMSERGEGREKRAAWKAGKGNQR